MKAPLRKNQIGKFLSAAADSTGIQRIGANVSNHSVRKTSISRLLDANTPENFVAQLSGHKNTQSLQSYKSASEKHQRQMSHILSRTTQGAPKLPDSVDSYHLPENQTSTGQLMTTESVQQSTSTNSLAVTQTSLNQHPGTSDVNSRATFSWVRAPISSTNLNMFQCIKVNETLE